METRHVTPKDPKRAKAMQYIQKAATNVAKYNANFRETTKTKLIPGIVVCPLHFQVLFSILLVPLDICQL